MPPHDQRWDRQLVRELKQTYGDDAQVSVYSGRHHARYFRRDTTYHIIARTLQGYCLMRPDEWFNSMAAGVIGRAQLRFESIDLYAFVFMSSHFHLQLRGEPGDIAKFVGFIKGEISRRLGQRMGRDGTMWHGRYLATALPTPESELRCFEYILSHGVKEGLVARSTDWPGLHAAKQLGDGSRLTGRWLDGTALGRAKHAAKRRRSTGNPVVPEDYIEELEVELAPLPVWRHLTQTERHAHISALLERIEATARKQRGEAKPLGAKAVLKTPLFRAKAMPSPPWFEDRKKMICWADPLAPETRAYLNAYWSFQRAFRTASEAFLGGDTAVVFPAHSYSPPMHRPPSEQAPPAS